VEFHVVLEKWDARGSGVMSVCSEHSKRKRVTRNRIRLHVGTSTERSNTKLSSGQRPEPSQPRASEERAPPWVSRTKRSKPPTGRDNGSIPHIPFINLDPVPAAQRAEFVLIRHLPMMLLLIRDVGAHLFHIRFAHGERAVPALPVETAILRPVRLHPLRWLAGELRASVGPLLSQPWILDIDVTVKPLYGHQQGRGGGGE